MREIALQCEGGERLKREGFQQGVVFGGKVCQSQQGIIHFWVVEFAQLRQQFQSNAISPIG